jgi:hypothetical protein
MDTNIVVTVISSSTAIVVAAISYWLTKKKEREAEWRKEKLSYYKEYLSALSNKVALSTHETDQKYCIAFNTVGLFSSQTVIEQLHAYQELTKHASNQVDQDEHDKLLSKLILEIRKDLKLKPEDNEKTFSFRLISPYKKTNP